MRRAGRLLVITLSASLLPPAAALALEGASWFVGLEGGLYSTHGSDTGPGGSLRFGREAGAFGLNLGLTAAPTEGPAFGSSEASLELFLCRRCSVRPYVAASGGLMIEDGFTGPWLGVGVGLEFPLGDRDALCLASRFARHDGQAGPHFVGFMWKHRFGGH